MNKTRFRLIVVASIVLAIISGVVDVFLADAMTAEMMQQAEDRVLKAEGLKLIFISVYSVFLVVYAVVTIVGVMLFWRFARWLYIAGFVLIIPFYLVAGTFVTTGIGQYFYDLAMVAGGVILALMYTAPIKDYFEASRS